MEGKPVYLANHLPALTITPLKSLSYKRVQRLDQTNAKKPAKLPDSKALTLSFSCKQNLAGFFQFLSTKARVDVGGGQHFSRGSPF
jgi:hypothetical protein